MSASKVRKNSAGLTLAILIGSMLAFVPMSVTAASLSCGSTITSSTRLTSDIGPCGGNGITIGANNVILNCAGHTISGTGTVFDAGVLTVGVKNVVVMNCHITGFYFDMNICCNTESTVVMMNKVENPAGYPMFIDGDQGVILIGNAASGGSGINVADTVNSVFLHNSITDAFWNGFTAGSGSTGNVFVGNIANGNGVYGFADFSTGTGTSGTANIYANNLCSGNVVGGSNPAGLCRVPK